MSIIWHNGTFIQDKDTVLTIADRALRGHGVFDTMLIINGVPCHAPQHFKRLIHDARILGISPLPDIRVLEEAARQLLHENSHINGRYALNTIITGGISARGLAMPERPEPQIIVRTSPSPAEFPPPEAIISQTVRRNEGSPLSNIKSINYGDNILALNEARKARANEAILLNNTGNVACATTGNIFIARGAALYTPLLSDGAMAGIVRGLLLQHHGAKEKTLTPDDLQNADGIYITNSLRGLSPLKSLNGAPRDEFDLSIPKDFHE